MTTREDIVNEARKWLGVRWVHQGRTRNGIDCAGLVACVGKDLGLITYDTTDYQRRPDHSKFTQYFESGGGIRKNVKDAAPGDVMIFREKSFPCHTAIVSTMYGQPAMIHAFVLRKMVVEELIDDNWAAKRVACFQYPNLGG